MPKSVWEYFTGKIGESYDPRFTCLHGTLLFDFGEAGSWLLSVDRGKLKLEEKKQSHSESRDCWIRWNETEFLEMINHQRDFLTSFQQGRIQVEGSRTIAAAAAIFLRNSL